MTETKITLTIDNIKEVLEHHENLKKEYNALRDKARKMDIVEFKNSIISNRLTNLSKKHIYNDVDYLNKVYYSYKELQRLKNLYENIDQLQSFNNKCYNKKFNDALSQISQYAYVHKYEYRENTYILRGFDDYIYIDNFVNNDNRIIFDNFKQVLEKTIERHTTNLTKMIDDFNNFDEIFKEYEEIKTKLSKFNEVVNYTLRDTYYLKF